MQFTITVKMLSDWHIGLGQSKGDIDSLVQRDADKLPYVPAKTLTGILRDSCELVARGLDDNQDDGVWSQWVEFLFGSQPALAESVVEKSPQPAILSIRSAHLPDELKNALTAKKQLSEAIAFIKPGISIDSQSGCAKTDFLRFEEMIRVGAILQATNCQINFPPDLTDIEKNIASSLLLAGAKMTERIGGKRRRGAGKCQIELGIKCDNYLQHLTNNPPPPRVYQEAATPKPKQHPNIIKSDWYIIPLEITTTSPVVINSCTIGNVVETLDYIPGKYILRNLHRRLGQWLDISQSIQEESIVVTNATIAIGKKPGRPIPFCLFADKLKGGLNKELVYNRFTESEPENIQLKGIRDGYVGDINNNHLPPSGKVEIKVYTHNTIEDQYQRPSSDVGGVYSYQAIASRTQLRAEIRLKSDLVNHLNSNKKDWWKNLNGEYLIGQSKKDDYGTIIVKASQPQVYQPTLTPQDNTLTLWLLSDLLLRDERLHPSPDLNILQNTLAKALGVELNERDTPKLISVMARQKRTESWQVRWGLPRPSLIGIQAGSCLVYEVTGDLNPNRLAELQAQGIGERVVEGYGQICFNDPLLTMKLSPLKAPSTTKADSPTQFVAIKNNQQSFDYARIIEREAWREAIQQQALSLASQPEKRQEILGIYIQGEQSKPPITQLGALRSVISKLQTREDKNQVLNWLQSLETVANRRDKWPKDPDSLKLIEDLINDEEKIWLDLNLNQDLTITQNGKTEIKKQLWAEAIRTLVDAFIRAQKRDSEKSPSVEN